MVFELDQIRVDGTLGDGPKRLSRIAQSIIILEGETMCNKYNGWTNYETWNVALWLDNEQGSHFHFVERGKKLAAYELALEIENYVENNAPDLGASTYADLLGAALSSVNWHEIAESF